MEWIVKVISNAIAKKFTGFIQLNLVNGTIANINLHETIRPDKE